MTKNHWTKQIYLKSLNKELAEKVKNFLGQLWTDSLKKSITQIAFQFVNDNDLDDTVAFAVVLEKNKTNTSTNGVVFDIFRGIKIVI